MKQYKGKKRNCECCKAIDWLIYFRDMKVCEKCANFFLDSEGCTWRKRTWHFVEKRLA